MVAGKRRSRDVSDPEGLVDPVDAHVARWLTQVPDLDPLVEGATTRLIYVVRAIRSREARAFAGSDFTYEDMHTLHALMVQPYPVEATPAKLAEECNVTRAAMTSRLDRLVDGGYVTREVDPLDRRRVIVRPTAAGRKTWDQHLHAGMQREGDALAALARHELATLNHLLRKVLLSLED
jgi:DNA-binding MarR family transcriptional regulator